MKFDHNLTFSSVGRYTTVYEPKHDQVFIWDTQKGIALRFDSDSSLSEAIELVENEQGEVGPLSVEEVMYLFNVLASVETLEEFAQHDLHKFGQVGVS